MDRRTFVVAVGSVSLTGASAGCIGQESDDGEEEPSADGDHRDVRVEAENLSREADNQIVENGRVSVIVNLKNVGMDPEYAELSLQMRDRDGANLGSPYTQQQGPIEPEETIEVRFEIDEDEDDIGGYELVVRSADPEEFDGNSTAETYDRRKDRNG